MIIKRLIGALCAALISVPALAADQSSYVMPIVGPMSMATFANTYLNPALRALASCSNGTTAPANGPSGLPKAYQCWIDTTANPSLYKIYDGASWITLGSINTATHAWVGFYQGSSSGSTQLQASAAASGILTLPQGTGLTLVTATPVMTTTQSAKTTIFYTPYHGNLVPIYDGTNMVPTAVAEISVATTDTTKSPAAIGASKVNDWFVWSDAGTIRIGHGPDWTSDTARSAGTALVMVNGILSTTPRSPTARRLARHLCRHHPQQCDMTDAQAPAAAWPHDTTAAKNAFFGDFHAPDWHAKYLIRITTPFPDVLRQEPGALDPGQPRHRARA
jgi:hypothetical protein